MTSDGAFYNCIAFHRLAEGQQRNATAMVLYKLTLARQDRKTKPMALAGPVLFLYGDDEFMKRARPQ